MVRILKSSRALYFCGRTALQSLSTPMTNLCFIHGLATSLGSQPAATSTSKHAESASGFMERATSGEPPERKSHPIFGLAPLARSQTILSFCSTASAHAAHAHSGVGFLPIF